MISFQIKGSVKVAETAVGVPGLFLKAYDKDLLFDDLLGSNVTGSDGRFEIVSELRDFAEFFERRPDIYLRVYDRKGGRLIHSTESGIRWNAGRVELFDVLIPRNALGGSAAPEQLQLHDDRGRVRTDYDPGESLSVSVRGLQPNRVYDVTILDGAGNTVVPSSLLTNARGEIEPTTLWPQLGLVDLTTGEKYTVPEAQAKWRGRRLTLRVGIEGKQVLERLIPIAETFTRPLLLSTDPRGYVRNGFEVGQHDAVVSAYNVPFHGTARVYLVPRQHDWSTGDRFAPVQLESRRLAFADVEIPEGRNSFTQQVAATAELAPGAYDIVIRPLRYGYEDDEDLVLRDSDLVTRTYTGLVVRWEFMKWKAVLGGCTNTQMISGRTVSGAPYFQYADCFEVGEDIYAALDPAALMPGQKGKMVALYVVKRPVADYNALAHLPQLGGNAAVQKFLTQTDCINHNKRLIWSNASDVGEYDIIADFGNDTADPASFASDASFDQPLDLVDGKLLAGFRVVQDPGVAVNPAIAHAGSASYNQSTQGTVTVDDPQGSTSPVTVNLIAEIRFPSDVPGATNPSQISGAQPDYPLLVCVHGNGHSYLNYTYLLEHWAKNGFIAASIHLNGNMAHTGRAAVLFRHLDILKTLFAGHIQNKIGIMGHSRGGEGVVSAARMNQQQALGHGIEAIISLGPTDQYTPRETLAAPWSTPYLVMHGAMDGDVANPGYMGFSLYDRASGAPKSMLWLYGANHNRFNLVNPDADYNTFKISPTDHAKIMTQTSHMAIAKAYMTAFFRWHILGASELAGAFRGEWVPATVQQAEPALNKIYFQYGDTVTSVVDNFEQLPPDWQSSTLPGAVGDAGTLPVPPQEARLPTVDAQSPHDTRGLLLRWNDLGDRLVYTPTSPINASAFAAISFRVAQKVGSAHNPPGQAQDFYLTLTDTTNKSRSIRVAAFGASPPQQQRAISAYTVTALSTIRIPLHVYQIEVINTDKVDISQIKTVAFDFKASMQGELEIDSVELTN